MSAFRIPMGALVVTYADWTIRPRGESTRPALARMGLTSSVGPLLTTATLPQARQAPHPPSGVPCPHHLRSGSRTVPGAHDRHRYQILRHPPVELPERRSPDAPPGQRYSGCPPSGEKEWVSSCASCAELGSR